MLPDYSDIRELTDREPVWYTTGGVPRYREFHPSMLGVYDKYAVLKLVGCQACGDTFLIGVGVPRHTFPLGTPVEWTLEKLLEADACGDPPRHGCVGDTMSVDEYNNLEGWVREGSDWKRVKTKGQPPVYD